MAHDGDKGGRRIGYNETFIGGIKARAKPHLSKRASLSVCLSVAKGPDKAQLESELSNRRLFWP